MAGKILTNKPKKSKYSYSKINVYHNCPMRYKLEYVEGHYIPSDTLAIELGQLVHWIEEHIGIALMNHETIDYEALKKDFYDINIPKKDAKDKDGGIFGINILKEKFKEEFFKLNDQGSSYYVLCQEYVEHGIYRLENFIKENPDWEVDAVEQFFEVDYYCQLTNQHYNLHGFIDRILHNTKTNEYIVEDIKTRSKLFPEDDLKSPMQFFFYSYALKSMKQLESYPENIRYDLVLMDERQAAGTRGWIDRCHQKLDSDLYSISQKSFAPKPSPLCYYCPFSGTNPDKGKLEMKDRYLCPYYSLWTKGGDTPVWKVEYKWAGESQHDSILLEFKEKAQKEDFSNIDIDF